MMIAGEKEGFGMVDYIEAKPYSTTHLFYNMLLKTKDMLAQAVNRSTGEAKSYYQLLLFKVEKALDPK